MNGYFESMRKSHPVKLGDMIEGKKVVATFWQWTPKAGDLPMFRLEGETEARIFTR
jgi:hypothetical protein